MQGPQGAVAKGGTQTQTQAQALQRHISTRRTMMDLTPYGKGSQFVSKTSIARNYKWFDFKANCHMRY